MKNLKYRKTEKYRINISKFESSRRRKKMNSAHQATFKAIRQGQIKRNPCEICGAEKAEGQHKSYLKKDRLKVNWLCKIHHEEWHMKNKPIYPKSPP